MIFFSNIAFEFSSDYFIHGNFYPDYSEKINLKGYGLLCNSKAPLQTPKPGRSLANIKFNAIRKGENNKVTLGQERRVAGHPFPNNLNDCMSMQMQPVSFS